MKVSLRDHFVRLHNAFKSQHPYRVSMLQALLLALLFDCKGLYEDYRSSQKSTLEKSTLAIQYQQLLEQHYISLQSVQAYAGLLNVTPNHLSQAVTNSLGRRAQDLIVDRLLLAAKKLLRYTDLPIMDIADYLGVKEPTHFGRLFKRKLALTPLEYRRRMAKEE